MFPWLRLTLSVLCLDYSSDPLFMLTFASFLIINLARICTQFSLIYIDIGNTSKYFIASRKPHSFPLYTSSARCNANPSGLTFRASPPSLPLYSTPPFSQPLPFYVSSCTCALHFYAYIYISSSVSSTYSLKLCCELFFLFSVKNTDIISFMAAVQEYRQGGKSRIPGKRKRHGFSNKCTSLVKEQRARLYILRRCATMLLCWYIQGDE
ncbi:hypothetical protein Fmac_007259 [Flemingia macrophylla]|uniref:Uncharacterized protein n=1 Tax=Flemingia macrophylla TaxID=520843 RepID=A0ABD1ND10_9FABA